MASSWLLKAIEVFWHLLILNESVGVRVIGPTAVLYLRFIEFAEHLLWNRRR